eukprot:XP_011662713.1 PREDICTED: uncharacterized protein LOC105437616 [Strongylocentrotus purpuratus]
MSSPSTSTGAGSRATTSADASTSSLAVQTSVLPSEYRTAEAIVSTARDVIRQVREGRHQLPQHNSDSDSDFIADARPAGFDSVLQTTRTQFRRRRVQDSNEQRRRGNPHNLDPQSDGKVELQRNWSLQRFEDFVIATYPDQPLARTGFRIGCCSKSKRVTILEDIHNVLDIDKKVGRGQILIIPNRDLHAVLPPTQQPPTQQPQVNQPPLHEQPAHQPRLREQPADQPRLREQPADQPRLREQPAHQPRLREQPADQPRLREQPADQPRLREQPADQPHLREQPADQPRLREQPADQPRLREQPADQPRLREQPADQPRLREQPADQPRLREQPADQPRLREQPADQPRLREQPADQPRLREHPADQPRLQQPEEAEAFIVLSDFELSSDESLDDHTPNEEQNAETGTPTIVIQPNRRAFSNLEALLQAEEITVVFHRSRLMEEMLEFYKNASTVNKRLKVIFDGEDGEDIGGLTREAFTSFWNAAHRVYFAGENVCLPFLPNHRMHKERENMVSLGRILSHTALLTKTFPSYIAKSVYIAIVFNSDVNETCLLEDLKEYVTRPERRLISKALSDFDSMSPADVDDLTQVFMACDFHAIPSKGEVRAQLLAIADLIFVQKPAPIYRLIRQGIPEEHILTFWSQLSIDDISIILKAQKPTPRRVSAAINTGELDDLNNNQDRVLYFLRQYINSLRAEELQDFLQFCTGSIHMPLDGIKVCFNKNFGSLRRPIAHTCSNVLEISELYTTYQEFRREFHLYLSNSMSFTFSSL